VNKSLLADKDAFRRSVPIGTTEWGRKISIDLDMKNNCKCEHVRAWHLNGIGYCGGIYGKYPPNPLDDLCYCESYHPKDNLKYLEWKYNESIR
jgi:hypothetical protein